LIALTAAGTSPRSTRYRFIGLHRDDEASPFTDSQHGKQRLGVVESAHSLDPWREDRFDPFALLRIGIDDVSG
jgi:hypothetical protein